ncbi:MAG: metallophosphoesterase [Clostridiales bacterium]|nr:metallophosphoesterase [Clostridiales bacterium]
MYLIAIAVGLIMLLILWSQIELMFLTTSEYTISSKKLSNDINGTKFVVLSDLHNHSIGKENRRLINKIDSIAPDFIIIAGDMVTKRQFCVPSNAYNLLKRLSKKYKIYYGYGNHEQYFEQLLEDLQNRKRKEADIIKYKNLHSTWVEYKKRLINLGIVFLDNDGIPFTRLNNKENNLSRTEVTPNSNAKLLVSGLSLDMVYYLRRNQKAVQEHSILPNSSKVVEEYIRARLGKKDEDIFHILIAHNPIYYEDYVSWGADLILSGHVHGGLVRLPFIGGLISPSVKLFPKYDAGMFTKDEKTMIISRGLGTHSNMPRIFNPPELVVVRLIHDN